MKALAALAVAALLAVGAMACSDDDNTEDGTGIGDNGAGDIESAPLARTPIGGSAGSLDDDTDDEPVVVSVESTDETISIGQATIRAGKVTFEITNEGLTPADFHVLKTETRAASLPMDQAGEVDIEAGSIDVVETVDDIQPGDTETVTIDLDTGHYVILSDPQEPHTPGLGTDVTVSQSPA